MKSIQLSDGRKMSFLHHVCEKVDAPTIVFAHGFPLDHSMWQGQLPLAEAANLVMPDLQALVKAMP
jgi:pimeloyl-ACP methyl ester carboxylesterase